MAFASHADADHIAGLIEILDLYEIEEFYWNGQPHTTQTFQNLQEVTQAEGSVIRIVSRGDSISLGSLTLKILHPATPSGDSNVDSIVVLLECGDVQLLLTGDAEVPSESSMLAAGVLMDIDILKVGHHGSRSSTSGPFLDMIRPEVGIISAGLNSQYGHPHQEIVERLTAAGVELWHTDISDGDDTVKLTSDCQSFSLERALFPPEPSVNPTPVPTPNPMPLPTATPLSTATPVPTDVPSPTPPPSAAFGSGALRVGADIEPGTYQNSDSSRGCYWARLLGFSGGFEDVIASKFDFSVQIVTVRPSDLGYSSISDGYSVLLTHGEVRHAKEYPNVALYVLWGLTLQEDGSGNIQVSGGTPVIRSP